MRSMNIHVNINTSLPTVLLEVIDPPRLSTAFRTEPCALIGELILEYYVAKVEEKLDVLTTAGLVHCI